MKSKSGVLVLFSAAAVAAAVVLGCSSGSSKSKSATPGFDTTVVIGDSLSAGFQNGSLLDTQQPNGWASLVAKQGGWKLVLPLVAPPGAPSVLQLTSLGPPPLITQVSGTTSGRDDRNAQPTNLAVPGHLVEDLVSRTPVLVPVSKEDIITDIVLGLPLGDNRSQLDEAIHLKPTALFVWIGSNDALVADEEGTPSAMTPVSTFTQQYQQMMSKITANTKAKLIVANIPDVTLVPYLTPATQIIGELVAATKLPAQEVSALLGIQPGDLVNAAGLTHVESDVTAVEQGQAPTPLTDAEFLSTAEVAQVQATVDQYNQVIAQQVSSAGGTLIDMHAIFEQLSQGGVTINGYTATTGFLGGLFGLDGIHPTNTGYALIANQYIAALNAAFKTRIQTVDVSAVATSDPLFGPNIKPVGAVRRISARAARQVDEVLNPAKSRSPMAAR